MLEISVHRGNKKVIDYKKKKSTKLFGIAGLLAIPTTQEIQQMLENAEMAKNEYNTSFKAFEDAIKGCESSVGDVNKLLEKCEVMIDNGPITTPKAIDVSNAGRFKDWLLGNSTEPPRISDLTGVNEEYLQPVLDKFGGSPEEQLSTLERLARSAEKIEHAADVIQKIYNDIVWIIQHPLNSILIVLEGVAPIIVTGSVIIIIIGLIAKLLGSEKLFKMNTKDMIINPIIFLIIYLILITALRCVVG